jgi:hypothetical protein
MDAKYRKGARLLRHPGQALDEQIDRVINDKFLSYYLFAAMFWVFAGVEWIATLLKLPRRPIAYTIAATFFSTVAAYQFLQVRRNVKALRQGRDSEREVAELLDCLKQTGAQVIHDVPGDGFNIDHVVVSTRGIYAIETKNWTKPHKNARIEFDGQRILIEGKLSQYDPVNQCRAQTNWIREYLKTSTSKDLPVRGVIVFPGWWVDQLPQSRGSEIWVLNPKYFVKRIDCQREIHNQSDASMATLHLQQYVRNS